MGWTTYQGGSWGSAGAALSTTSSSPVQLVRLNLLVPEVLVLELRSSGPADFTIRAGTGNATSSRTIRVDGRAEIHQVGETLLVDAIGTSSSSVDVSASVAGGSPQASPPSSSSSSSNVIAALGTLSIAASGRRRIILHNSGANAATVNMGGFPAYALAAGATLDLDYAGALTVSSTAGTTVAVHELYL